MENMKAKDFIELWKKLIIQLNTEKEILKDYKDNSNWSRRVLGSTRGNTSKDSPLGNLIESNSSLDYRTEDYKIDIAFGRKNDNFNEIKCYIDDDKVGLK